MNIDQITAVLSDSVTTDLIEQSPLLRVAYTGTDGAPGSFRSPGPANK